MQFLIHCRKKHYLKYLFQAAEESLGHYIKKTTKPKQNEQATTTNKPIKQKKNSAKKPFLFMRK